MFEAFSFSSKITRTASYTFLKSLGLRQDALWADFLVTSVLLNLKGLGWNDNRLLCKSITYCSQAINIAAAGKPTFSSRSSRPDPGPVFTWARRRISAPRFLVSLDAKKLSRRCSLGAIAGLNKVGQNFRLRHHHVIVTVKGHFVDRQLDRWPVRIEETWR